MTPEQVRQMSKDELLELLQSALNMAKHMSLVEDPRVHGAGEGGPLMAIGDLEIWPRGEPGARMARLADVTRVQNAQIQKMRESLKGVLEVADLIDDETGHQSRHILNALNFVSGHEKIEQRRCAQCGITHPPQVELAGPYAWKWDAERKWFCSWRCFNEWMRETLDQREEDQATTI